MTNQEDLLKKTMIEDKLNRPIPQHFDETLDDFKPNTLGVAMAPSGSGIGNPYQPDFSLKMLLVDKKGRVIPQYYDVDTGEFAPLTTEGGGGGGGGTSGVLTVNMRTPDALGNVDTDFRIIDALGPDVPPTDYPLGSTEFYMDYDPSNYTRFIDNNPTMQRLEAGQICVRTFKENDFIYQQIDNVKNGIFEAAYVRVSEDNLTWSPLSGISKINVIDNLTSDSETDALSAKQGKVLKVLGDSAYNLASIVDSGLISHAAQKASTLQFGHVKVDGTSIVSVDGVISAVDGGGGGQPGPQGPAGKDGATWYSGTGTPTFNGIIGNVGDKYLEYGNGLVWTKGTNGWAFDRDGTIRGNTWMLWSDMPPSTDPLNGDLALKDDGTVMVYSLTSDDWEDTGVNLKSSPDLQAVWDELNTQEAQILQDRARMDIHINTVATDTVLGHVKVDNDTIASDNGEISVIPDGIYRMLNGYVNVKDEDFIPTTDNLIDVYSAYAIKEMIGDVRNNLPIASLTQRGIVQLSEDPTVQSDSLAPTQGMLVNHMMQEATETALGHVRKTGDVYSGGVNNVPTNGAVESAITDHANIHATNSVYGHVKVDNTTIKSNNGEISAVPSITINNDTRPLKMWAGTTTVTGGAGEWSINFSAAGFVQVRSVQVTIESAITTAADKPLGTYIVSRSVNACNGKAYKVSSAGLLAAMQQIVAEDGTTIHVLVIGH